MSSKLAKSLKIWEWSFKLALLDFARFSLVSLVYLDDRWISNGWSCWNFSYYTSILLVIVLGEHEHHIKRKAGFSLASCDLTAIGVPK